MLRSIRPKRATSLAPAPMIGPSAAAGIASARCYPGRPCRPSHRDCEAICAMSGEPISGNEKARKGWIRFTRRIGAPHTLASATGSRT
jgi:hypothetical protein